MAFLQPVAPRQPIFRVPAAVLWLIVALAAAHVARILAPPGVQEAWINAYAFIPARVSAPDGGAWWQRAIPFVSHMGLHNDFVHLAINSLWLLAFGPVVARRFGTLLFLIFFLVCGVAGAAAYLALNWGSPEAVIGASGAISGLMAAGLRLLPTTALPGAGAGEPALLPILSRQILLFSLVWVGMNIIAGVTGMGAGGETALIAWQAHLGGFIAGMLLAGPFDRLRPQPMGVQVS